MPGGQRRLIFTGNVKTNLVNKYTSGSNIGGLNISVRRALKRRAVSATGKMDTQGKFIPAARCCAPEIESPYEPNFVPEPPLPPPDLAWVQLGSTIPNISPSSFTGTSVSFNNAGTRVVIGAPQHDGGSGMARVFELVGGNWVDSGFASPYLANSQLGQSVSMSGDGTTVAIGAPGYTDGSGSPNTGQIAVYERSGGFWTLMDFITPPNVPLTTYERFGQSVSISNDGTIVAIGAPFTGGDGVVLVYEWSAGFPGSWGQMGVDINGLPGASSLFGQSVSISNDGTKVAIGASQYNSGTGVVQVWEFVVNWVKVGGGGGDIIGQTDSQSGSSVSLNGDGNIVAIGAPNQFPNPGEVTVHEYIGAAWTQIGETITEGGGTNDTFGSSVSINNVGDIVAIGAPNYDSSKGLVKVYEFDNVDWTQMGGDVGGIIMTNKQYGSSVSLSGDGIRVAIGAPVANSNDGEVLIYNYV